MCRRKLNILVVDDHPDTVTMLEAWLAGEGHLVIGLTDLGGVESTLCKYAMDVVLIDLLFSGRDSTSTIRWIRSAFPSLQIIVMSGTSDLQLTMRAIDAGADSYLTKPIEWDVLHALLQNIPARS